MNAPFLGGLFFLIFGLHLLKQSITSYRQAKQSEDWIAVPGRITKFLVFRPQATSNHRVLSVDYEYQHEGALYQGQRVAFYTLSTEEILALEAQQGDTNTINVHINPQAPSEACLIVGRRSNKGNSDIILASLTVVFGACIATAGYLGYLN